MKLPDRPYGLLRTLQYKVVKFVGQEKDRISALPRLTEVSSDRDFEVMVISYEIEVVEMDSVARESGEITWHLDETDSTCRQEPRRRRLRKSFRVSTLVLIGLATLVMTTFASCAN